MDEGSPFYANVGSLNPVDNGVSLCGTPLCWVMDASDVSDGFPSSIQKQVLSVPSHSSKELLKSVYDICSSVGTDVLHVSRCDHSELSVVNALNIR
jgi:hypothetical protein